MFAAQIKLTGLYTVGAFSPSDFRFRIATDNASNSRIGVDYGILHRWDIFKRYFLYKSNIVKNANRKTAFHSRLLTLIRLRRSPALHIHAWHWTFNRYCLSLEVGHFHHEHKTPWTCMLPVDVIRDLRAMHDKQHTTHSIINLIFYTSLRKPDGVPSQSQAPTNSLSASSPNYACRDATIAVYIIEASNKVRSSL